MPQIEPLAIGVCRRWSLQVKSIPELKGFMDRLAIDVVQIACGDPHHAAWDEGDAMPTAAKAAGFRMTGAMLGFPGVVPATIAADDPAIWRLRPEGPASLSGLRSVPLKVWERVGQLEPHRSDACTPGSCRTKGDPDRKPLLDVLS